MNHATSMSNPYDPNDDRDHRDALSQLADDGNPHGGAMDDLGSSCPDSSRNNPFSELTNS
jgi:hypothetical protein